jgi:hypothetical protein
MKNEKGRGRRGTVGSLQLVLFISFTENNTFMAFSGKLKNTNERSEVVFFNFLTSDRREVVKKLI